jgi:preprotein translocase subunit SecG
MEHGTTLLAVLHILIAVFIVIVVLLQDTKGGVGGAFGGGGSNSLLGATGAENFLAKSTKILGFLFAGTCIGLTLILSHKINHSVVDALPAKAAPISAPAAAVPAPGQAVPQAPPASK